MGSTSWPWPTNLCAVGPRANKIPRRWLLRSPILGTPVQTEHVALASAYSDAVQPCWFPFSFCWFPFSFSIILSVPCSQAPLPWKELLTSCPQTLVASILMESVPPSSRVLAGVAGASGVPGGTDSPSAGERVNSSGTSPDRRSRSQRSSSSSEQLDNQHPIPASSEGERDRPVIPPGEICCPPYSSKIWSSEATLRPPVGRPSDLCQDQSRYWYRCSELPEMARRCSKPPVRGLSRQPLVQPHQLPLVPPLVLHPPPSLVY